MYANLYIRFDPLYQYPLPLGGGVSTVFNSSYYIEERRACLIVTELEAFAGFHPVVHQRQRSKMRRIPTNATLSATRVSNPPGSTGGYRYCHLRVNASSPVWCLNIRLFDTLRLFQVRPAGRDGEQISHEDFNRSAERQTSLSSLIKAWPSFSGLCMLQHAADEFPVNEAPSSGLCEEIQGFFLMLKCFLTVVFFLLNPQWQWCCFWLGSLLLWLIHLMGTKLQVIVEMTSLYL